MTAITDTDIQFRQSLFDLNQHIQNGLPEGTLKASIIGILENVTKSYLKKPWDLEEIKPVLGLPGLMATLESDGRQHMIGFRYDKNQNPEAFIWSVLDYVGDKPINHQIVIPLSERATAHEKGAEIQYWLTSNPANSTSLVAEACLGMGLFKNIPAPTFEDNSNLASIPLDLFKITL